jgi:hypothetical protein
MQLRPFKELVALSKEKLDEAMAPIRARQVKAKADLEMLKIESDILTKETKVQEMCVEKDINLPKLIDALDEIALLERRRDQYGVVLEQLFPTEKK